MAANERVRRYVTMAPPAYSLLATVRNFMGIALLGLASTLFLPVLVPSLFFIRFITDNPATSGIPVILTTIGVLVGAPIAIVSTCHATGWVPWQRSVGFIASIPCIYALAAAGRRLAWRGASKYLDMLLQRTLAIWALLMGVTPATPASALAATLGLKLAVWALGQRCRAPTPHVPGAPNMRVLVTGDSFAPKLDGPCFVLQNCIKCLVAKGHQVHVFCSNGHSNIAGGPEQFGATVTRGPGIEVYPKHKVTLPTPWYIYALLTFRPHIVHFADLTVSNLLLLPLTWLLGIESVVAHHSRVDLYACYTPWPFGVIGPQVFISFLELLVQFASGHLLCDASQALQPWFHGLPLVRSWTTGCDTSFFHPSKADPKVKALYMRGRPELPMVLFVGRLDPQKQCELMVDVVRAVNPPGEPEVCRFVIIGDGPSRRGMLEAFGDRADVHMPGVVKGEPVAQAFASADLFFTPTVTGTLDLVFLESMASALPVVAPRAVAVPEVITDGVNGMMYAACDVADCAHTICAALPLAKKMKPACRPLAESMFTHLKMVNTAIELYEDALAHANTSDTSGHIAAAFQSGPNGKNGHASKNGLNLNTSDTSGRVALGEAGGVTRRRKQGGRDGNSTTAHAPSVRPCRSPRR